MDPDKALRRERVGLYAFTMQGLYATGVAAESAAWLGERLPHRHAHNAEADDVAPVDVTNRARVRLACANAIPGAVELGDFAREPASTRSSRAVRSSSASATWTRFISRSSHATTILL